MRKITLLSFVLLFPAVAAFSYPMTREASGTSWQPDSTPHEGHHAMLGDWHTMLHGYADLVYDRQGGPRGGEQNFLAGMLMASGRRPLGPGTFGLRAMLALDPNMGPAGYPLLLQNGETADGQKHLVDRQHPHDLFMELSGSYSYAFADETAAFVYAGLPGEPALGPPAFMHRFSGADLPEAPIGHHWLDSTHIAEGVATLGVSRGGWQLEGSAFRGREPDKQREDIEKPDLDSHSVRLSWNPTKDWSLQTSWGRIHSPEGLSPDKDQDRFTASASMNSRWAPELVQQTTFALGRTQDFPGRSLTALLLESGLVWRDKHRVFGRIERVEKDELFEESEPQADRVFAVGKFSLGYRYDLPAWKRARLGLGTLVSFYGLPHDVRMAYGSAPVSLMLFARARFL